VIVVACGGSVFIGNNISNKEMLTEQFRQIIKNINLCRVLVPLTLKSQYQGIGDGEFDAVYEQDVTDIQDIFHRGSNIYVLTGTNGGTWRVRKYTDDGSSASFVSSVTLPSGTGTIQVNNIYYFVVDASENYYVFDTGGSFVGLKKYNSSGTHQWNSNGASFGNTPLRGTAGGSGGIDIDEVSGHVYFLHGRTTVPITNDSFSKVLMTTGQVAVQKVLSLHPDSAGGDDKGTSLMLIGPNIHTPETTANKDLIFTQSDGSSAGSNNLSVNVSGNSHFVYDEGNDQFFYTSSTPSQSIYRASPIGTNLTNIGSSGSGLGKTQTISEIAFDQANGRLYVCDEHASEENFTMFSEDALVLTGSVGVNLCPMRMYASNECSSDNSSIHLQHEEYTESGRTTIVPTSDSLTQEFPRDQLVAAGEYYHPYTVLMLRDFRQCLDEMGVSGEFKNMLTGNDITRDWSTSDDLYFSAITVDTDIRDAIDGTTGGGFNYRWQRELGTIAALPMNAMDVVEIGLVSEFARDCTFAMFE